MSFTGAKVVRLRGPQHKVQLQLLCLSSMPIAIDTLIVVQSHDHIMKTTPRPRRLRFWQSGPNKLNTRQCVHQGAALLSVLFGQPFTSA